MFKITRAARQILNSTKYIKDLVASSTNTITKYLKLSENQGYIEDVSHEFLFEKKLSEFANLKVQNSLSDLDVVMHKEGAIDWAAVRKLIYARFADEIRENKIIIPIKAEAVKGIREEFECLRAGGYDFKSVVNLIEQKKAAVSNKYELEVGSNVSSSSLIDRMKQLSIAGYLSNYAGDDGLRQSIEEVIHNKAYLMQEFMLRVSSAKAYEVNLDQLESIDILGDH